MNLQEIKTVVNAGGVVYWSNGQYRVIVDSKAQWFIKHANGHCIGLTWADGVTLNGKECDFFTELNPVIAPFAEGVQLAVQAGAKRFAPRYVGEGELFSLHFFADGQNEVGYIIRDMYQLASFIPVSRINPIDAPNARSIYSEV